MLTLEKGLFLACHITKIWHLWDTHQLLSVLHSSHSADKQRYCESTPCDKPPLQDKGQILERDHIRRLSKKQGKKREVEDNFFLRSLSVSFSLSVQLLLCYFWTLFFFSQCDSLLFLLSRFLPLICFSFVFTRAATKNIVFCLGVSPRLPPALRKAIFFPAVAKAAHLCGNCYMSCC